MKASRLAVAVMASTLMGAGLLSASATSAGAVTTAQAATADPCVIRDGTSSKGYRVGSNPTRYTYDDTPYLGARYNSCTDKVTLYYGGYSAAPGYYYNLRTGTGAQWEVQPGSARKYTMRAPGGTYMTAMVQLCRRGELLHRSTCTRWSPQVRVALD